MTILMWVVVTVTVLALTAVSLIAIVIGAMRALPGAVNLILHGQRDDVDTTIWVVACPKTKQLTAVEVSSWRISQAVRVTDCFNSSARVSCRQECLERLEQRSVTAYCADSAS